VLDSHAGEVLWVENVLSTLKKDKNKKPLMIIRTSFISIFTNLMRLDISSTVK
jgi:hypothetical protein